MTTLPIARTCGGCTACCKSVGFHMGEGLAPKKRGTWCSHVTRGSTPGCGVQATKPDACKQWSCHWLLGWAPLVDEDRPDKVGIAFDTGVESGFLQAAGNARGFPVVFAHERHPGAAADAAATAVIRRVHAHGYAVVIADAGGPREVRWPDGTSAPLKS